MSVLGTITPTDSTIAIRPSVGTVVTFNVTITSSVALIGSQISFTPAIPTGWVAVLDSGTTHTLTGIVASGVYPVSYTITGTGTDTPGGGPFTVGLSYVETGLQTTDTFTSTTASVTIENIAPTNTIASIMFSADTGSSSTDFITKTASQTISGTLSANLATGEKVQVSLDNGSTWSTAAIAAGTNTWSLAGQTLAGINTLLARVVDFAGNPGLANSQAYVLDITPPAAAAGLGLSSSSDTGLSNSDGITSDTTPTITGLAENGSTVTLYDGVTLVGTVTAGAGGWTYTTGSLSNGSHALKATATDAAGNVSPLSATLSITIDTISPSVTSVGVPASGTYSAGQNLDFTINASEAITVDTTGGTPRIALVVGATTAYANYVSGSDPSSLLFRYTVQAGDQDANGIAVGALSPNGGSLRDAAGNNMVTTLNSVGSTAGVNVSDLAPVFTSASVNGNSLVVSYIAASSLDSINIPGLSAYQVTANGAANAVTAIVIDPTAKTATLTLATAVTAGQAVTIAYTDPTSGNDPNALQSSTGEDAASLAVTPVTNNTTAPTAPTYGGGGTGVVSTAPEKGGVLSGTIYGDILKGLAGKDTFYPGGGADSIDGGDNVDTVVFSGARGQYTLTHNSDGTYTVRDMLDPSVSVAMKNIERVNFSDQALAIDATPESARLAELYHLALGRKPDDAGLQYHLGVSNSGATTSQIIASFVASSEFTSGQGRLSDSAFLTQLYGNAFDRSPDAGGFAYWMQQLAHVPGTEGRAQVMEGFLASSEMTLQITGQVDSGIALLLQA